jgi:hypothetical protein
MRAEGWNYVKAWHAIPHWDYLIRTSAPSLPHVRSKIAAIVSIINRFMTSMTYALRDLYDKLDGIQRLRELQSHVLDSIRQLKPQAAIEQITVQELVRFIRKLQPVKDEQLQRFSEAMQELSASISSLAESGNSIAFEQKVI